MIERISINPNVCHGKLVIKGTRVLVSNILGALASGRYVSRNFGRLSKYIKRGYSSSALIYRVNKMDEQELKVIKETKGL